MPATHRRLTANMEEKVKVVQPLSHCGAGDLEKFIRKHNCDGSPVGRQLVASGSPVGCQWVAGSFISLAIIIIIIIIISIFYRRWPIQLSWFARGLLFTK